MLLIAGIEELMDQVLRKDHAQEINSHRIDRDGPVTLALYMQRPAGASRSKSTDVPTSMPHAEHHW
jgi:hypothetical protein